VVLMIVVFWYLRGDLLSGGWLVLLFCFIVLWSLVGGVVCGLCWFRTFAQVWHCYLFYVLILSFVFGRLAG